MSIQNIYGSIATTQTSDVSAIGTSTTAAGSVPPPVGGAESATISTPGQLFSELQQLSQSDPTKFKAVAGQLATSFQNAAANATGPEAKMLTNLANTFSAASQSGTLQPPQAQAGAAQAGGASGSGGAHHHHHHHGGGSGGSGQSSAMDQAFQNAMTILTQATQGTSATTSTLTSTTPTAS